MRNALSYVPKAQQSMASAALRQAFIQPDRPSASQTLRHVADQRATVQRVAQQYFEDARAANTLRRFNALRGTRLTRGQVILVTGAARRVGSAIVRRT